MMEHNNLMPVVVGMAALPLFLFILKPLAVKINLIDHPDNNRKRHNGAVPLTGGLAILLSLIAAFTIGNITTNDLGMPPWFWFTITVLLALLVMTHAIDDIIGLDARSRLIIDGTLALLIATVAMVKIVTLGNLFGMGELTLGRFAIPMTIFSFIAASNAFNMTDGIDSQCTGFGLIAFGTLMVFLVMGANPNAIPLVNVLAIITLTLVPMYLANTGKLGAGLRSFLGDSGARLIGFMAAIAIIIAASQGFIDPVYAFFPIAVPVCDCLILAGVRIARGHSPVAPDRRHLHHLLMKNGLTSCQARRVGMWLGIAIAVIGIGMHASGTAERTASIVILALFVAFMGLRAWLGARIQSRADAAEPQPLVLPGQQDTTARRPKPATSAGAKQVRTRAASGDA